MTPSYKLGHGAKFLRRFYEPLILLSVLEPTRGAIKPDLITDRGLNEQAKLWRDFLDQASFLCDSCKGGDTVTAIAAQKAPEQPVFWLASNSSAREKAKTHFEWILARLERLYENSTASDKVEEEILDRCVKFNIKRIKKYAGWLVEDIDKAMHEIQHPMTHENKQLFGALRGFRTRAHDYPDLCHFAHTFRYHDAVKIISQRHNAQDQRSVWSNIRHQIGRLGNYTKAVRIVIQAAQRFPQFIENAKVQTIGPVSPSDKPNPDDLTDFGPLINRMMSERDATMAEALIVALSELNGVVHVYERFREAYREVEPRPHAELLVLEKFHSSGFEFVHDDRYIGCSKPSCYCCHLYMQCHPGRFSPRPCHGNLWRNWAPPIPLPSPSKQTGSNEAPHPPTRLQEHHTFKILQQMVVTVRQDLQKQILSRRPRQGRQPDSTTGMSSVDARALMNDLQVEKVARASLTASSPLTDFSDFNQELESIRSEYSDTSVDGRDMVVPSSNDGNHGRATSSLSKGDGKVVDEKSKSHPKHVKFSDMGSTSYDDDGEERKKKEEEVVGEEKDADHENDDDVNDNDNNDEDSEDDDDGGVLVFSGRRHL